MVNSRLVHDYHHAIAVLVQFTCFQGCVLKIIQVLFLFVFAFIFIVVIRATMPDRFQLTGPAFRTWFPTMAEIDNYADLPQPSWQEKITSPSLYSVQGNN